MSPTRRQRRLAFGVEGGLGRGRGTPRRELLRCECERIPPKVAELTDTAPIACASALVLGSAESGVLLELYRLARSPEEAEAAIAATEEHRRVGAARKNFRPYQPKVSASLFRACRLTGHLAAVPDLVRRQRELGLEVGIPG